MLFNVLFTVTEHHFHGRKPAVDVLCQMLCAIDAAVLSAGASEAEHERGEPPFQVALHMGVGQAEDGLEEREDLAVVFQELDDGLVESGHLLVLLIASRVVGCPAVEHVAAAVTAGVLRDAPLVGEAVDAYFK